MGILDFLKGRGKNSSEAEVPKDLESERRLHPTLNGAYSAPEKVPIRTSSPRPSQVAVEIAIPRTIKKQPDYGPSSPGVDTKASKALPAVRAHGSQLSSKRTSASAFPDNTEIINSEEQSPRHARSGHNGYAIPEDDIQPPSPKRARFNVNPINRGATSVPMRPITSETSTSSGASSTAIVTKGPTRPFGRRHHTSHDHEGPSSETEVAYSSHSNSKSGGHTKSNGRQHEVQRASLAAALPIASVPRWRPASPPEQEEHRPRPSTSKQRPIERELSLELPEVLPASSPKKSVVNAVPKSSKGKERAENDDVQTNKTDKQEKRKVLAMPLEADFHSLDELGDFQPHIRPTYPLWVLARCAIMGSGIGKVTIDGLISRISDKYEYYHNLAYESGSDERARLVTALKTALKGRICFIQGQEDNGEAWYAVDAKVNPAERRQTVRREAGKSVAQKPMNGQLQGQSIDGGARKSILKQPTKPPEPQFDITEPEALPPAELSIFATSLTQLIAEQKKKLAENETADNSAHIPPAKREGAVSTHAYDAAALGIPYDLAIVVRAAILGSRLRKLKLAEILKDICWAFPSLDPKEEEVAKQKLSRKVTAVLSKYECFYAVRYPNNRVIKLYMVDAAIDPRKVKSKPTKAVKMNAVDTSALEALKVSLLKDQPPSAVAAIPDAQLLEAGFVDGRTLAGIDMDLAEMEAYFSAQATKWNRRLAYLHASEIVTKRLVAEVPTVQQLPNELISIEASVAANSGNPPRYATMSPSPELEAPLVTEKPPTRVLSILGSAKRAAAAAAASVVSISDNDDDSDEQGSASTRNLPSAPAPAPVYVCGHQDMRTGAMCEMRLESRDARETHLRFEHGVVNSNHLLQNRLRLEADRRLKKQAEQQRVNRKLQGRKPIKRFVPEKSGRTLVTAKKSTALQKDHRPNGAAPKKRSGSPEI